MLKILSWNIQQGGGSRMVKIVKAIQKIEAHVVVLSEFHNNDSGMKLRNNLTKLGYIHQVVGHTLDATNTVGIFSKIAAGSAIFEQADPKYSHGIVRADFSAFRLYGAYFPHKKKHRLFEFLLEDELDDAIPSILVGDINTGKNYIDQKGDSFWYTEQLESLEERGFLDAFRLINGDISEFSWYSHQGNGYRYDHSYIDYKLKSLVKNCYYHHEYREDKCADHSPMILELA